MQAIVEIFLDECNLVKNNRNAGEIKNTRNLIYCYCDGF